MQLRLFIVEKILISIRQKWDILSTESVMFDVIWYIIDLYPIPYINGG